MTAAPHPATLAEVQKPGEPMHPEPLLESAERLLAQAHSRTLAFALSGFGDIELPSTPVTEDDQAQIRSIATLYLAAQLEAALLVPAVELLAGLAVSGGIKGDIGAAAQRLVAFWRQRQDRFSEDERSALYLGLFGAPAATNPRRGGVTRTPSNPEFETLMINLCEALYRLEESGLGGSQGSIAQEQRVRLAANMLAENILQRAGGMTAFAGEELLATIRECVSILSERSLQSAFGARSLWTAVRAISRRYWGFQQDPSIFVARGKSGLTILAWLAEVLPRLGQYGPLRIPLDHPVISASIEWLQASLTIEEARTERGAGA